MQQFRASMFYKVVSALTEISWGGKWVHFT